MTKKNTPDKLYRLVIASIMTLLFVLGLAGDSLASDLSDTKFAKVEFVKDQNDQNSATSQDFSANVEADDQFQISVPISEFGFSSVVTRPVSNHCDELEHILDVCTPPPEMLF